MTPHMPKAPNPDLPALLMDAALTLLDERGDVTFSMRELASRVGYSVTAVYRCYETRGHLLRRLTIKLFDQLAFELGEPQGGTPRERVRWMGTAFLAWAIAHPGRFRLMFQHEEPNARLSLEEQQKARAGIAYIQHLLQQSIDQGQIDHPDAEALAITLFSSLCGLASLALTNRMEGTPAEDAAAFFQAHIEHWLPRPKSS